jgi:hypothetical protein
VWIGLFDSHYQEVLMPFSYNDEHRRHYINVRRQRDRLALMRRFHAAGFCPKCHETPEEILRKNELALEGEQIELELARLASVRPPKIDELEALLKRLDQHAQAETAFLSELQARHERMKTDIRKKQSKNDEP